MQEFAAHIKDLFAGLGQVQINRMFGGYGIFCEGIMFGLIADGQLYLKADEDIAHYFHMLALPQFEYRRGAKMVKLSYFCAPDAVLEDPQQAVLWGERSFAAARRQHRPPAKARARRKA